MKIASSQSNSSGKSCAKCGRIFVPNTKNHRYCREDCKKEMASEYQPPYPGVAPATVGAIAELAVASDLMAKGWNVFRAISSACFCDLIAHKSGEATRYIEVRSGRRSPVGTLSFPTIVHRQGVGMKVPIEFGVYVHKTGEIIYLPGAPLSELRKLPIWSKHHNCNFLKK